ncbi:hypothetical protein SAMN05443633_10727 [Chryseobacterium arachidis]|uniref:Uncharacterized protein n=1 Tax=Chryseobacterium arachidis TaxID=1416778 RepID=A0A1M5EQN1_9FLAO|nr:hypothetical protein SAMN05443633_10727 [Chryseobacterium arachidis]
MLFFILCKSDMKWRFFVNQKLFRVLLVSVGRFAKDILTKKK